MLYDLVQQPVYNADGVTSEVPLLSVCHKC